MSGTLLLPVKLVDKKGPIEKAGFVSRCEQLPLLTRPCDRLYCGNEFCERLLPGWDDLQKAAAWATERAIPMTLVTPFVTDQGLQAIAQLLEKASGLGCLDEVVFNDWGVLSFLSERPGRFSPVLGRLLTKQKRGPRILLMRKKAPAEMLAHFRRMSADSERFSAFLFQRGVKRIELDNLLQGIERTSKTAASLYLPYAYVSTTRYCLTAYAASDNPYFRKIGPCQRQCRKYTFELRDKGMPVTLLMKGNTYFFENRSVPENLEELGIDRIVEMPALPM